jgi:hypothetical protein
MLSEHTLRRTNMSPNKLNIEWTYPFALLSLFLLSCSECEEVPYVVLNPTPTHRCPNYYIYTNLDSSRIDMITSDEDIDRYAVQSITDYASHIIASDPNKLMQDESNRNRMISELTECIREYHVDFSKYSIAAIATPSVQSADRFDVEVCSNKINVYVIIESYMNMNEGVYSSYLQVPKGNYKLNFEKIRAPNGPY